MERYELLRQIPQVDEVLKDERLLFFVSRMPGSIVTAAVRKVTERIRTEILAGDRDCVPVAADIAAMAERELSKSERPSLRRVINATGVILHTNLGRACLSLRAREYVGSVAGTYSTLEFDLGSGQRGSRHCHVEQLICRVTGAEAAMVVNNNAAATMLCLSALAQGKEVITSRGELVEIGGSFRIPEIMELSGAILREVGTTNKTRIDDYERAFDEEKTGALLKVHTSNYRVIGFTQEVSLPELTDLGREKGCPVIYDMGSGLILPMPALPDEPTVTDALKCGVDAVLFSGDKLLGGAQGGVLAGKKIWIDKMKKHPLARAIRADKLTLAAMEATFYEYLDPAGARRNIPVLKMLSAGRDELRSAAYELTGRIAASAPFCRAAVVDTEDKVGGGCAPLAVLPGCGVSLVCDSLRAEQLVKLLREADTPIIARILHDEVLISMRTLQKDDAGEVVRVLAQLGDCK